MGRRMSAQCETRHDSIFTLLTAQALLGAFDHVWNHEINEHLPSRRSAAGEITLHWSGYGRPRPRRLEPLARGSIRGVARRASGGRC